MSGASSADLPREGDIIEGTIARIEAYGAFCRLDTGSRRPLQGLIHISQLVPDQRVERVDDVLSVEDRVWVKVLKVEMDPASQRWRIQLSRKDVSQDGLATDLGLERESQELRKNQLESNLNSMIGMGVARDPMANRLTMKNAASQGTTFHGGYSLVGDDEGEPEPVVEPPAQQLPPMGRGRGTTLPAWMTQASEGPTGKQNEADDESDDAHKKKKKHKKKHSKSHRKTHKKHSSSSDRKRKRSRRERASSDSESVSDGSLSYDSRSDRGRKRRKRDRRTKSPPRDKDKRKSKGDRSRGKDRESDGSASSEDSRRR